MRKATIFIVVALLLTLCSAPVYASTPLLPHAFYGNVTINGSPARTGTTVEARGEGVLTGIAGNPITVTETGKYGGPGGLDPKLVVQGDIADEATITFYVNGKSTGETYPFDSGEVTELPLSVTTAAPPGPAPPRYYIDTNLFGIEASYRISDEGELQETIEATSEDGMLTMTIETGTIALLEDKRLSTLTAAIDPSPPEPPADCCIIGLAFDFGPEGATFDPGITFEYTYNPEALPEGVAEEDLVIAFYDAEAGEWVTCDCTCDPEANCITACVCHFTTFAIIAVPAELPPVVVSVPAAFAVSSLGVSPSEVAPSEEVTISVLVANTGGESGSYTVVLKIDGVKEVEETVTVAAGSSQTVSFSVTKEEAGSYTVTVDGLSDSFTVVPVVVPPEPAAFSVSYLSVSRLEVEPGETVTITVFVANTGGESGSYTVVLKIDGVKEAEETVTVAAGESQDVSFSVTREEAGRYTVAVDGLSGSFTVVALVKPPGINWAMIGGIIAGVIVVGLLIFFVLRRREY
ncbi:hypothetical protein ES707_05452 [subsurface metagenome]